MSSRHLNPYFHWCAGCWKWVCDCVHSVDPLNIKHRPVRDVQIRSGRALHESANTFAQLPKVRHVAINLLHHCLSSCRERGAPPRGCIDDRDGFTPRGASTMQLLTV